MNKLVTLTTDFGLQDAYVGAMKGVMLSIDSELSIVDISHAIAPQDIMEAAFVLRNSVPYYPKGTTHLVVVDPGVGSARKPVAIRKEDHFFVGPDNGLFSLVFNGDEPDEIVHLDNARYWRTSELSTTFHGRDLFAPVAAHLASGVELSLLGTHSDALKPLHWALPIVDTQGVQGWVVHIDRFGNCITNISKEKLKPKHSNGHLKCYVGSTMLDHVSRTYAESPEGEAILLFGSHDMLEIAVNSGNASELLSIRKGDPVNIVFLDDRQA